MSRMSRFVFALISAVALSLALWMTQGPAAAEPAPSDGPLVVNACIMRYDPSYNQEHSIRTWVALRNPSGSAIHFDKAQVVYAAPDGATLQTDPLAVKSLDPHAELKLPQLYYGNESRFYVKVKLQFAYKSAGKSYEREVALDLQNLAVPADFKPNW